MRPSGPVLSSASYGGRRRGTSPGTASGRELLATYGEDDMAIDTALR